MRTARGFSLVEIAIVLVVVGLIISGGIMGVTPVVQANKITTTNGRLDVIEKTVLLYVVQNGCLPCPAAPSLGTGLEDNGSTALAPVHCSSSNCTIAYGVVPWASLGLARQDVIDPYGSYVDYTPSVLLTESSTAMARTPPAGYPLGALAVKDAAGTDQQDHAAYVLISHGADGSNSYAGSTGDLRNDPNNSAVQACNQATPGGTCTLAAYVQDTTKGRAGTASFYDDIVRFQTAPNIIQLCGSNACGNP